MSSRVTERLPEFSLMNLPKVELVSLLILPVLLLKDSSKHSDKDFTFLPTLPVLLPPRPILTTSLTSQVLLMLLL